MLCKAGRWTRIDGSALGDSRQRIRMHI